mmetsp:Transcript_47732/g.113606  ORF Transcript_47732/g.113606 Transcript_47732/m.113606 type:complete len:210 (+) Transcript_47732:769-1398(+)
MSSSTRSVLSSGSMLLAPNTWNSLSSSARKKRELPGSPWRPARPRSCLSMRRDSCRSVPITCNPPSSSTSAFSLAQRSLNTLLDARYAARSRSMCEFGVTGPVSEATASIESSSFMFFTSPTSSLALATAASIAAFASSVSSGSGMHAEFSMISILSFDGSPFALLSSAGASFCMMRFFAKNPALPPRRMSVPRAAMLVATVIANARPA